MRRWKEHKYFTLGVMILAVVAISLVMLAVVLNLKAVGAFFGAVIDVLTPLFIGIVLAYLMNPLMNFMDRRLYPYLKKRGVAKEKASSRSRAISVTFALLVVLVLVYEFCALLLPQLYDSISGIVGNFSGYYDTVEGWITSFLADNPAMREDANEIATEIFDILKKWTTSELMPGLETIVTGVTSSILGVVGSLADVLIGIFLAIYMLYSRDSFLAQIKKVLVAVLSPRTTNRVLGIGSRVHKVFSGFVIGSILDSLIIGVLCYIGMLILGLPYPALIATVVGVTNVIPFFGPFIGAIPSGILILLVNPLQALYFGIFILVLQQLDGNVIKPRILGDAIGISGFWILMSITVGSGLFGFPGMLLGVPVFAVIYALVNDYISYRLKGKQMPQNTQSYQTIQKVEDLSSSEADK